jgi:hypothetical protein
MINAQHWDFSYVSRVRNHVKTQPLRLVSIDSRQGSFSVDQEIAPAQSNAKEPILFRACSGGISIVFKSRLADADGDKTASTQVELPYKVCSTQLRKDPRVFLEAQSQLPVTLYMSDGSLLEGAVIDVSVSGAKFMFEGDVTNKFKNFQSIDACKITLPNDNSIQAGLQQMGLSYDQDSNVTIIRGQFLKLRSEDEALLEVFLETTLLQLESETEDQTESPFESQIDKQTEKPAKSIELAIVS